MARIPRTKYAPGLLLALLCGGLALAALSCARPAPRVRPYAPPSAAELAQILAQHQTAIHSMNARVRATSWLGGDRVRATVLMLVERPTRLRFEAEVSLQGTVAVLTTDGSRFMFLDVARNELRRGPACPDNVASLIRIPLGPEDVAAILLGDARVPEGSSAADGVVDWDPARGMDVLAIRRDDGWLRIFFQRSEANPGDVFVGGATVTDRDGRARWRVAFEDPADSPLHIRVPRTIRFAEREDSFDDGVEIKFKERTLNQTAADGAFALVPPPGAVAVDVGCSQIE